MRAQTILAIIGGLVALVAIVLIGGYVYLTTLDANDFRAEIAAAASAATGRAVTLGGPLVLEVSGTPRIVAENVSVANAPWGSRPAMAHI
ncbi:MAG: hypothetical protein FJX56_03815 [Alphaproteobacteria bacterium]|nr:hypothetical protein [Alphaproteobacteria bacterium]